MKKLIIFIFIVIFLVYIMQIMGTFDSLFLQVDEKVLDSYDSYYYNQLDLEEKIIYTKIDKAVRSHKEKVFLGIHNNDNISQKIEKVIGIYIYDNPQYYYLSNRYTIGNNNLKMFALSTIKLEYILGVEQIEEYDEKFENAIDYILKECVTDQMLDFEKELAIHDYLVKHVNYYNYEDISIIPIIKHTAYSALVDKEAVCDGYSKAFKILLDKVGIESEIINGSLEGGPHAWNVVKLDGEYYHVDVTSDKIVQNSNKYVIHRYFNIDDNTIKQTHFVDNNSMYPKCQSNKYEYYRYNNYEIGANENLRNKMDDLIAMQKDFRILECKINKSHLTTDIINALYFLNFNNWYTSGKKEVTYNKINDVYVFVK